MKTKAKILRKRLLTESAIAAVVLVVIGAATYFIDTMNDDYTGRKNALEGQVSAVTNEMNGLREKYIRIQKDKDLYQKVMEMTANDTLSSNIDLADARMWEYKKAYGFSKLALKYGDPALIEDAKYKRPTTVIGTRASVITFEGAMDEDVYELVQSVSREFPGAVAVNSFSVSRVSNLTDDSLRTLSRAGKYTLVKGQMGFTWLGMQSSDPEAAKKAAARSKRR